MVIYYALVLMLLTKFVPNSTIAHWSRGGQQFISKYLELKIVSKDLGRSFDENLRKKNWDICLSGSYDLKG